MFYFFLLQRIRRAIPVLKWLEPILLAFLLASSGFEASFQIVSAIFLIVAFYFLPPALIKPAAWLTLVTVVLFRFTYFAIVIGLIAGIARLLLMIWYHLRVRKEAFHLLALNKFGILFSLGLAAAGIFFLSTTDQHRTDAFHRDKKIEQATRDEPKQIAQANSEHINKQELTIVERNPITTLDPCSEKRTSLAMNNNIYEGLMVLDGDKLRDGVAHHVKISADKLTYTFILKPNAKWSDGKAVTAYDFEYSWKKIAFNGETFRAVTANVFEVKLPKPNPDFLAVTSESCLMPLRGDLAKKHGEKFLTEVEYAAFNGAFLPTGSGPSGAHLVPNPKYWDRNKIKLKSIWITLDHAYSEDTSLFEAKRNAYDREAQFISSPQLLQKYKNSPLYHPFQNGKAGYLVQPYVQNMTFDRYDRYYLKYASLKIAS
jgi:ABC-type transport system substrate-binding protein